jgi:uncharacterized protein YuzE
VTFDRSADAAYIYIRDVEPGGVAETVSGDGDHTRGMINLDYDEKGRLVGIEILGAKIGVA